ncbi:MAG: hypothetical protein R3F49_22010 [Planctomycetota bacterium]
MTDADPNLDRLEEAATKLGDMLAELVLVGGCATGLLVTDSGAAPIRPTIDVDLVVDLVTYSEFHLFEKRLRALGFEQRQGVDQPICRWWHDRLCVDIMPVGEFMGFTNPWYASAFTTARTATLPSGARIRHVDGPHFLATKLAAFESRGAHDPVTSHDAEDVVLVLDGRPEIESELACADSSLRGAVARGLRLLVEDTLFCEGLEGYFDRRVAIARAAAVRALMERLSG